MTYDAAHFPSAAAHEQDRADADFHADRAEADRLDAHGPLPLPASTRHGSRPLPPRPVVAGPTLDESEAA